MSDKQEIANIKGCKDPFKTTLSIGEHSLGGIESITIEYTPDNLPVAIVRLIDFNIDHKGGVK